MKETTTSGSLRSSVKKEQRVFLRNGKSYTRHIEVIAGKNIMRSTDCKHGADCENCFVEAK